MHFVPVEITCCSSMVVTHAPVYSSHVTVRTGHISSISHNRDLGPLCFLPLGIYSHFRDDRRTSGHRVMVVSLLICDYQYLLAPDFSGFYFSMRHPDYSFCLSTTITSVFTGFVVVNQALRNSSNSEGISSHRFR